MAVWIAGISHYVPPTIVDNVAIIARERLKARASWIEKFVGIRERRWADADVAASDLAVSAVRALSLTDFRGSLFVSTVSPDYLTPSTASVVKHKLGLTDSAPAVDVNAACAGQLFALDLAVSRLERSTEREALVIATEVRSRFLNPKDRRTVFLFGDGACAILLRRDEDPPGLVEWTHSATMATGDMEILVPAGGSARPLSQAVLDDELQFITLNDGPKIMELTTGLLVEEIQRVLLARGRSVEDFDFFAFHQGNAIIASKVCAALGVPVEKTWSNFDRYGNTSSASLGIALSEAVGAGRVARGNRVLLVAMGAGHHVGISSVIWAT